MISANSDKIMTSEKTRLETFCQLTPKVS